MVNVSGTCSDTASERQGSQASLYDTDRTSVSSDVLSEVLVLPKPKEKKSRRKGGVNAKTICITDDGVLEELKSKEQEIK